MGKKSQQKKFRCACSILSGSSCKGSICKSHLERAHATELTTTSYKGRPCYPKSGGKERSVPMNPPLEMRKQFIGHSHDQEPKVAKWSRIVAESDDVEYDDAEDSTIRILNMGRKNRKYMKKVTYYDLMPGDIMFPGTSVIVKHTNDNEYILSVASPRTSGEVIRAERASVQPSASKPPLPPSSALKLFKPHSGIIINKDKYFVPDVVYVPGSDRLPQPPSRVKKPPVCPHRGRLVAFKQKRLEECRRKKRGTSKKVRINKQPYMGDDETCGLEEMPPQEQVRIPPHLKRGAIATHSLTILPCTKEKKHIRYGVLMGTFNMYDSKFSPRSRGRQALVMSVAAYCLAFHYHPKQWTMKLIDNLVDAGDQWYLQCADKVHDHSAVQGMCEVLPFGKKQVLSLNKKKMQVLLGEPDIVGYTMTTDPTVYNLCRGLKAFFKDYRAGVLLTRVLKVVIWRDKICYYIFDPAGRDSRAYSNFSKGCAALINVKDLDNVAEVLLGRTVLEDQKFVLAPVKVLKILDEKDDEGIESDKELTQTEKAMMGYRILNESSAIVNANMHLGDRCFEDTKYRQALPIAITALTYSKISPPNTWYTKTIDKILRLGNKLFVDATYPKTMVDISVDNIPSEIIIGPYRCEIIIYRDHIKGQLFTSKECILNIRTGLKEFFSGAYTSGILEFNNYTLGIWKQKDMFYLFDPYPRTTDGLRTIGTGKACCWMFISPEAMTEVFINNWKYLPVTTQFSIHAFKVLRLKKGVPKARIICCLSQDGLGGKRKATSQEQGDGVEVLQDAKPGKFSMEDEQMGDIVSLIDSIQEDYLPPIPLKYKAQELQPDPGPKIANLDSPTVSVTQVVPPWPKPRDKSHELAEPDPSPEPTPPPTPPPPPVPEGEAEEEEAEEEEEEDEETMLRRKEEEARRKAEEEEERRKAEELPPPIPPPPPSPQPEPEPELAPAAGIPEEQLLEDELQTTELGEVERQIVLTEDAKYRSKLRKIRDKLAKPLVETVVEIQHTPSEELEFPSNFKKLLNDSQIIRGSTAITGPNAKDILPFASIMAVVTSYKYAVNTWNRPIVNFIVDTGRKLHKNKKEKFQYAAIHVIPKIGIGSQVYHATIEVVGEGPTWKLEKILNKKFFNKYDRGILTTPSYSCALFFKNGVYYLYDGSSCNAMGMKDDKNLGRACFLRFRKLHDLACRINYNKRGRDDQQFILSRILVRGAAAEIDQQQLRMRLPEDYDYDKRMPKSKSSRPTIAIEPIIYTVKHSEHAEPPLIGYQKIDGFYRIEGTVRLSGRACTPSNKACHFVCLVAMLMATMHPVKTWDSMMVDSCIEKGLEIYKKAVNLNRCQRRMIKNVCIYGKIMNVNIKRITVINRNQEKTLEQYLKAVLSHLRFVIISFPDYDMVICQNDGYYHLFDGYYPRNEIPSQSEDTTSRERYACWTLYPTMDDLANRIRKTVEQSNVDKPMFYTFELVSMKKARIPSGIHCRLSPLFKPDENPNVPYLQRRKERPTIDEKLYWLNIPDIPWSPAHAVNDVGIPRNTSGSLWNDWNIEFPGDLYSLWGTIHPTDMRFSDINRGKQYLATCAVALMMAHTCDMSGWTGSFLDGIVKGGDLYHTNCLEKIGNLPNHEITIEDLSITFEGIYPYTFTITYDNVLFGFMYNIYPDRFNLSKALSYFFEARNSGILVSPGKNLAFGMIGASYFMYDCQSFGTPTYYPKQGASYALKCESLNRLIYCMTMTLNIRRHGQQFHLYSVSATYSEKIEEDKKDKKGKKDKSRKNK